MYKEYRHRSSSKRKCLDKKLSRAWNSEPGFEVFWDFYQKILFAANSLIKHGAVLMCSD